MQLFFSITAALFLFSGCSNLSVDQHVEGLNKRVGAGAPVQWIRTQEEARAVNDQIEDILKKPLDMESAVRIALLNNRALQKTYDEIGISHSELVEAGLMSNPILGYSVGTGGGVSTVTWSLEVAFLDLLWIPLRRELAGMELEETKLRVGDEVFKTIMQTRIAWIDLMTALTKEKLSSELLKSSEASAQLAARQQSAGNLSKRDFLKIWDEYLQVRIDHIHVLQERASAQEGLNRMMGVFGRHTHYQLSSQFPEFKPMAELVMMEQKAMTYRLDIAAARQRALTMAKRAGYTENTRLLDEVTLSAERERSTGEATFKTYGIGIPLPIFDIGQGKVSKAQNLYRQSLNELYELSVNVRSEVREKRARANYAYEIAQEYENSIVRTNQEILNETGLFYNGMLDGVYELLEDQRKLTMRKMEAAEARAQYLKALSELTYTIGSDPFNQKGNDEK